MPINQKLLAALNQDDLFTRSAQNQHAVLAFIQADGSQAAGQALIDNKANWIGLGGMAAADFPEVMDDNFLSDAADETQLWALQQKAAARYFDLNSAAYYKEKHFNLDAGENFDINPLKILRKSNEDFVNNLPNVYRQVRQLDINTDPITTPEYAASLKQSLGKEVLQVQMRQMFQEQLLILLRANTPAAVKAALFNQPLKEADNSWLDVTVTEQNCKNLQKFAAEQLIYKSLIKLPHDELMALAKAGNTAQFRTLLIKAPLIAEDAAWIAEAVTDGSLQRFKSFAAGVCLKRRVEQSTDMNMLADIGRVGDLAGLKHALKVHKELGFDQEPLLSMITENLYAPTVVAAYIHHHVFNATTDQMTALMVASENEDYAEKYLAQLPVPADGHPDANSIRHFFSNPQNVDKTCKRALKGLAKVRFETLPADVLNSIAWGNREQFTAAMVPHFGEAANQLYTEEVLADIKAYACSAFLKNQAPLRNTAELAELLNNLPTDPILNALPAADKSALQAALTDVFVNKLNAAQQNSLAIAKNMVQLKAAFQALGVNPEVLSERSLKDIQQRAVRYSLAVKMREYSKFSRPLLLNQLNNLSLQNQQELLTGNTLSAVLNAKDKKTLQMILNIDNVEVTRLWSERERIEALKGLNNPAIGEILSQADFDLPNEAATNALNDILGIPGDGRLLFAYDLKNNGSYRHAVIAMRDQLHPEDEAAFYQAFGLNAAGSEIINSAMKDRLSAQQHSNFRIHLKYNAEADGPKKELLALLLRVNKPADSMLNDAQINALLDDFSNSTSHQDFIDRIKGIHLPEFATALENNPGLKMLFNKALMADPARYNEELNAGKQQLEKLQNIFKELIKSDKKFIKHLREFSKITAMDWLKPEFQGAAKSAGHHLYPFYKDMAEGCDIIVAHLKEQMTEVNRQLEVLQEQSHDLAHFSTLKAQEKKLLSYKAKIQAELSVYDSYQKILNGDPSAKTEFLKKGVVQTLDEAKHSTKDVTFKHLTSRYTDYSGVDRASLIAKKVNPADAPADAPVELFHRMDEERPDVPYIVGEKVAKGSIREFTVGSGAGTSTFLQERGANDGYAQNKPGQKPGFEPSVRLTAPRFPSIQGDPVATHNACVELAMCMALQMLSELSEPPSSKNPVYLRAGKESDARYLWTALMILGENNPKLKFKADAITNMCLHFDPSKETNFLGMKNDFYKKMAEHPCTTNVVKNLNEYTKLKFTMPRKSLIEDLPDVAKDFKKRLGDGKTEGVLKTLKDNTSEENNPPRIR